LIFRVSFGTSVELRLARKRGKEWARKRFSSGRSAAEDNSIECLRSMSGDNSEVREEASEGGRGEKTEERLSSKF